MLEDTVFFLEHVSRDLDSRTWKSHLHLVFILFIYYIIIIYYIILICIILLSCFLDYQWYMQFYRQFSTSMKYGMLLQQHNDSHHKFAISIYTL